jgi:hypothetical protein
VVGRLLTDIRAVRASGYASGDSIYYPRLSAYALAVPLRSSPIKSVVLGVTGDKAHLCRKEKTIIDAMHRHAARLCPKEHPNSK